jgi:hypothetical protein
MIGINQFRLSLAQPRVAQPHRYAAACRPPVHPRITRAIHRCHEAVIGGQQERGLM